MRKNSRRVIGKNFPQTLLIISALVMSIFNVLTQIPSTFAASQVVVRVIPQETVLGDGGVDVVGTNFTVAVVVENVTNLYGLAIKISWNTTYLEYVEHTVTIPVEDHPDPIPPSPHAGILHKPFISVKDEVNTTAGTYEVGASSLHPAPMFNGSGAVFVITFRVIDQPFDYELPPPPDNYVSLTLHFIFTELPDKAANPILHEAVDGHVILHGIDGIPPVIENVSQKPPADNVQPEDKVEVNATVTDPGGVKEVVLSYTTDNVTWTNVTMTEIEPDIYNATIPKFDYCTNVTYKITAEDNAGNSISTEEMDYYYQYHVIPEFSEITLVAILAIITLTLVKLSKEKKIATNRKHGYSTRVQEPTK